MSDYDELETTIEQIIDEAIKQEMKYRHFEPQGDGFVYHGDEEDAFVPGRSNRPVGTFPLPLSLLYANDPREINPQAEVYGPWQAAVYEAFQPYLTMPRPEDFAGAITHAFAATERLSPGTDVNDVDVPANQAMGEIDYARSLVEDMEGRSVRAFNRYCLSPLPLVAASQCGAAANITESLLAEQAIWIKAQESIVSIADSMLGAMGDAGPHPSSDNSGLTAFLKVAGVVVATTAVFASGGWAVGVGLAGVGVGLLQEVIATQEQPADVGGSSPWSVQSSAESAMSRLAIQISQEERELKDRLGDLADRLQDDAYRLRPEDGVLDATDEEDYTGGPELLRVQARDMREVGGDVLPGIGDQFVLAGENLILDDDSGPWGRDGTLGIGPDGPFPQYRDAANLLAHHSLEAGQYVEESGSRFVLAAGFLGKSDEAAKTRLEHARGNVYYTPPLPAQTPGELREKLEARLG